MGDPPDRNPTHRIRNYRPIRKGHRAHLGVVVVESNFSAHLRQCTLRMAVVLRIRTMLRTFFHHDSSMQPPKIPMLLDMTRSTRDDSRQLLACKSKCSREFRLPSNQSTFPTLLSSSNHETNASHSSSQPNEKTNFMGMKTIPIPQYLIPERIPNKMEILTRRSAMVLRSEAMIPKNSARTRIENRPRNIQ